ncbi:hypothetical protein SAMN02745724_02778 [Pseudoalteromonas denitrificans DSM 6059]|uniref:Uncharacterized protein n=1 Tax=Pseudoalteromonas denitrificans DSM 6059 TaxID=1123010 RepID=A0A1I1MQJ8_9GAMM|nr:hypothetical protein SAMN02745724_02778 [Pseudoalteromonas denitrificans DSM 6059]
MAMYKFGGLMRIIWLGITAVLFFWAVYSFVKFSILSTSLFIVLTIASLIATKHHYKLSKKWRF